MTYEELLASEANKNSNLYVLTAENRAAIRNLHTVMKDRFIDVGIAEQTMIGLAAGLAARGRRPVVHALSAFLTMRAFEFIRSTAGLPNLPVVLVGAIPGFLSEANGPTHQAIEDIALMRMIPGMQVFAPSSNDELLESMRLALAADTPSYIRFFAGDAPLEKPIYGSVPEGCWYSEGTDITLITTGFLLHETFKAKALLENTGKSVGILSLPQLSPAPAKAVLKALQSSKKIVAIEDHFETGGLSSIVREVFAENSSLIKIPQPVIHCISLKTKWFEPLLLPDVLEHEGFTGKKLAERILKNE
ncbi:MAG: hypothetical protein JW904_05425 [Spirochaetales bacterium]|nr:hypothetical protein [Spirochaetales bacterium]